MRIERTKIHKMDRYLTVLPPRSTFKIVSNVDNEALARAGFDAAVAVGATMLPAIVGRTSRFNAEGRYVVRRDLPKEKRYVGSREFTRMEWHGQDRVEVTDTVDYYRMCYPREFVPPPAVELTLVESAEKRLLTSPTLQYLPENDEHNRHVINLMLELVGTCEIVMENLDRLTPPAVQRVNWVMLPPGEHPWERIEAHIMDVFKGKAPTVAKAVLARQDVILAHGPSAIFRGVGGFSDYLAYVFNDRHLVVLESIFYGNALYVLGEDWKVLSMLTKADIIRHGLAENRIIHSKGWVASLAAALSPKAAA